MPPSPSQARFLGIIANTRRNVFLCGGPGTGKTWALQEAKRTVTARSLLQVTVAPTGVAAFNASGRTIHSAFGPVPGARGYWPQTMAELIEALYRADVDNDVFDKDESVVPRRWSEVDVLFLDECSMVDVTTLALIDARLRAILQTSLPFGGLRVIASGDFNQLPPVHIPSRDAAPATTGQFLFEDFTFMKDGVQQTRSAWMDAHFMCVELKEPIRTADPRLITVLECFRSGKAFSSWPDAARKLLLSRTFDSPESLPENLRDVYRCFWSRREADVFNRDRIASQTGPPLAILPVTATFVPLAPDDHRELTPGNRERIQKRHMADARAYYEGACQWDEPLVVRRGTKVRLTVNVSVRDGIVNGRIGIVESANGATVSVRFGEQEVHIAQRTETYQGKEGAVIVKFWPLRAGYAGTFHGVQGITMPEGVVCAVSEATPAGMLYVGLSRAVSLDGVAVIPDTCRGKASRAEKLLGGAVKSNMKALRFYRVMREAADRDDEPAWEELRTERRSAVGGSTQGEPPSCCICFSAFPDVVFLPCKHMVSCGACWDSAQARGIRACPLDRAIVAQHFKPFM